MVLVEVVVFQHAVEGLELGVHGEEQSVEVASDVFPVFGADHFDIGVIGHEGTGEGLLLELDELDCLVDIAVRVLREERKANVFFVNVLEAQFVAAAGNDLDLEERRQGGCVSEVRQNAEHEEWEP